MIQQMQTMRQSSWSITKMTARIVLWPSRWSKDKQWLARVSDLKLMPTETLDTNSNSSHMASSNSMVRSSLKVLTQTSIHNIPSKTTWSTLSSKSSMPCNNTSPSKEMSSLKARGETPRIRFLRVAMEVHRKHLTTSNAKSWDEKWSLETSTKLLQIKGSLLKWPKKTFKTSIETSR